MSALVGMIMEHTMIAVMLRRILFETKIHFELTF